MLKTAMYNTVSGNILSTGYIGTEHETMSIINDVSNNFRFLYLVSGSGVFIDDAGNETKLVPGVLVQRLPQRRHSIIRREDGRWLEFFLVLPRPTFEGLAADGFIQAKRWILRPGISDDIRQHLDDYIDMIAGFGHSDQPLLLLGKTITLFNLFYSLDAGRRINSIGSRRMHRAADMLDSNLQKRISLTSIADELGISVDHLRKEFFREFGVSPKRYRIKRRIQRAQVLLCDQSVSIEETARILGYSDQFTFSRQFKQKTGMSPTSFRGQMRH